MKICYFITSLGHGRGGHFYSCRTIAEAYNKNNKQHDKIDLCIIGLTFSPVIKYSRLNKFFIDVKKYGLLRSIVMLYKFVNKNNYDILHAYDVISYGIVRIIALLQKRKIVLTKCGGPNIKKYPHAGNIVVFSRENFDYLKADSKYKESIIMHMPARTKRNSVEINIESERRRLRYAKDDIIILRITRFTEKYEKSVIMTINAFWEVYKKCRYIRLLLIGSVQGRSSYTNISKHIDELNAIAKRSIINLEVSDYYTVNASRFLPLADYVIGTGRSAMEAMAIGIPVFIPLNNGDNILMTAETAYRLLYYNLSGRYNENEISIFARYKLESVMPTILADKSRYQSLCEFSRKYFLDYLDVDTAIEKYEKFYQSIKLDDKIHIIDMSINCIMIVKNLWRPLSKQ